MIKSTKFAWMYIFLMALHCHFAMDKISLILKSPKEALSLYQHNDPHQEEIGQASSNPSNPPGVSTAASYKSIIKPRDGSTANNGSDETPSRTAPCNTHTTADRKQTASNDQTSPVQGSSTKPSKKSTERSEQQSGKNEDQDKKQHQGNAQQPNNGANDGSSGDKDDQDKQPNDDQQKDDQRDDEQEDKPDEEDEEEVSEDDEDQEEELAEDEHQEENSANNQDGGKGKNNSSAARGSACLVSTSDRPDTAGWVSFLDEPLKIQGMIISYPTPREKRSTPRPHHKTSFGRPIPEMLKPSKSKHLSTERPSTSSGFVNVDRILSEKAETRFKKAYEKKCKQQQDERINSIEDLPVSSEPYEINLLDRKFYYNDDGTENLYDGPEEIAAKLGLEYKGSPIVTIYPSSTAMKQPSGSSSHLPRSPPKAETERAMPENHKPKNSHTPTRITLAAYKEERRRILLERNQS